MLFAPPLDIVDLVEWKVDENGNLIQIISEKATQSQKEKFNKYLEECEQNEAEFNKQFEIKRK